MKKLLFSVAFFVMSFSILSCSKGTLGLAKVEWGGYYVVDTVLADNEAEAMSLAYDCFGDVRIPADTVLDYNHGVPPEVATTWREIHPGKMKFITVTNTNTWGWRLTDMGAELTTYWIRKYYIFKVKKIN